MVRVESIYQRASSQARNNIKQGPNKTSQHSRFCMRCWQCNHLEGVDVGSLNSLWCRINSAASTVEITLRAIGLQSVGMLEARISLTRPSTLTDARVFSHIQIIAPAQCTLLPVVSCHISAPVHIYSHSIVTGRSADVWAASTVVIKYEPESSQVRAQLSKDCEPSQEGSAAHPQFLQTS